MLLIMAAIENDSDREKVEAIYDRYYGVMFHTAVGILKQQALAEDAVSGAFVRIIGNLEKIRQVDSYQTRGFVVIIVRNISLDMLRQKQRRAVLPLEEELVAAVGDDQVYGEVASQEGCSRIAACIGRLSRSHADILYLKIHFEYSMEEIGQVLGISRDAAKMRLSRARGALKKLLREESVPYGE